MSSPTPRKPDPSLVRPMEGALVSINDWWTRAIERFLRIKTDRDSPHPERTGEDAAIRHEDFVPAKYDDGFEYRPPDYHYIYRTIRILRPKPQDIFYDIGSGKGRIVCALARRRMRKVIGIEISKSLCDASEQNAVQLRGRQTEIEIRCQDAATSDLSQGTIYYMYNPFGPETMHEVLANIRRSLQDRPRQIRVVYHNSVYEDVVQSCDWLECYTAFLTYRGARVTFWRNTDENEHSTA